MATEKESLQVLENLFDSGKFEDVISSSDQYLKEFPSSFHIGFIRCKALLKSGDSDLAESGIDNLLTIFPENINLLIEKGFLVLNKRQDLGARDFFEKALFMDPYNKRAKRGLEEVKKIEAGAPQSNDSPMSFASYEKSRATLEDTISESDLERLMEAKASEKGNMQSPEDSSPNVSISFEDSSMRKHDEILAKLSEKHEEENAPENIKMEEALEKLNKLSESDVEELKLNEDPSEISENEVVNTENAGNIPVADEKTDSGFDQAQETEEQPDSFTTESAAILYLKQKLYDDAEEIFIKLYKQNNPDLFKKKLDMIGRVKMLQAKVSALNNLMINMKDTGESGV